MSLEPPRSKGPRTENAALDSLRARMRSDWPQLPTEEEMAAEPAKLSAVLYSHDGPHQSAKIEWWYVNAHFGEGDRYSVFAAFFRLAIDGVPGAHAHAANWALVDTKAGTYQTSSLLDPGTPAILGAMIDTAEYHGDPFVLKALKEMFGRGRVLAPDRLMPGDAHVSGAGEPLHLNFGGNSLRAVNTTDSVPTYELALADSVTGTSLTLSIRPRCPPALSGRLGVVATGKWQDDMFYYFTPLCDVLGGVFKEKDGAEVAAISSGTCWIDHEFGGCTAETLEEVAALRGGPHTTTDYSWEWVAVQLHNASKDAISVTVLKDMQDGGRVIDVFAIYQDGATGRFHRYDKGVSMQSAVGERWTSKVTGMPFPTKWTVVIPHNGGVSLTLTAVIQAQEFVTLPGKPSYWEGRVSVCGTIEGQGPVSGVGFVECHGERNLSAVTSVYSLMHMMLCCPIEQIAAGAEATVSSALQLVTAPVEQAAMMIQMTSGKPMPPHHKVLLRYLLAVYAVGHHRKESAASKAEVEAACSALQQQWDGLTEWDFPTLVLRAFTLRTLDHLATNQCKWMHQADAKPPHVVTVAHVGQSALDSDPSTWLRVPSEEELALASSAEQLKAIDALTSGLWMIDTAKPRGNIGEFLGAQGVGFIARNLCASVTPDLRSRMNYETKTLETDIITAISTTQSIVRLDGTPWKWESFGRGTMTSRGCCKVSEDGSSCVVVVVSPVANDEVEVKWVTVTDGAMHEVLHLLPNMSAQPRATFSQWFKKK